MAQKSQHTHTIVQMRRLHKQIIVFGFVGLFACNLIQGGVFQAIVAWLIFVVVALLHVAEFYEAEAWKIKALSYGYYVLLVAWFIGIVILYHRKQE